MATLNLSVTVPDAQATAILADFCAYNGYQETINGAPNPQTKAQFAKAVVIKFVRESIKAQRAAAAALAASQTVIADVDAIQMT